MRIATSLTALLMALGAAWPAHAQLKAPNSTPGVASGPKLGQLEIKAYQVIPKTKTAVQLSSDTALARNLRREVMIRLSRRGNEVGFSGGNVMRMDVSYFDFSVGGDGSGNTIGGNPGYDGPGANPRLELPSNKFEQRNGLGPNLSAPTLRIVLTLYSVDGGRVLWAATSSCATHAGTAESTGIAMIDTIFGAADKSHTGDAGCPL
ncbi:MAG TPA: hypothetical protein VKY24_10880 [Reyranella sp.]|nr:hypothetical protein [Reyranella sp.]